MNIQIYLFDCLQPLFDEIERDVGPGQVGPRDLMMMNGKFWNIWFDNFSLCRWRMKMMVINYGDGQVHPKDVVGHLKSLEGSAAWAKNKKVTS